METVRRYGPWAVVVLWVLACAIPFAATIYLLAWPAVVEPNSAVPGLLASAAFFVVVLAIALAAGRVVTAVRQRAD